MHYDFLGGEKKSIQDGGCSKNINYN